MKHKHPPDRHEREKYHQQFVRISKLVSSALVSCKFIAFPFPQFHANSELIETEFLMVELLQVHCDISSKGASLLE
jgi:hypothetical protein